MLFSWIVRHEGAIVALERRGLKILPRRIPTMTVPLLIQNAHIATPLGLIDRGWLLVEEQRIVALDVGPPPRRDGEAQIYDANGKMILPGFIDLHVHGGIGHESMDGDPDVLRKLALFYAQHGVTGFLPTTWTAPSEDILRALRAIASQVDVPTGGATIIGAHVEGPYLNPRYCGAQDVTQIRRAERKEAMAFLETGVVRLLALAPEFSENQWLISECADRGIAVSAAHTGATYEQMLHAIALGLRQTTHTFNAMLGLHHREPGTVGAALDLPQLFCELIADGVHVHPAVMRIMAQIVGLDRLILITDAVRGAGLAAGSRYEQDGRQVVIHDDRALLPDGTLAGSTATMDRVLRTFAGSVSLPIADLWRVTSLNAARAIGLAGRTGSLEPGKDADLALLDDHAQVVLTVVRGTVVFAREESDVAH